MISKDGSLSIIVPGQKVTWFQFLQASRVTNSVNDGWNSKSYWFDRGLNLLPASTVDMWTRNSLDEDALPKPRKAEFKLKRKETMERSAAAIKGRDKMALKLKMTENELNAVLFKINWPAAWGKAVSYEVPLADESDGQLKIDLIGYGADKSLGERFISIIELKRADNTSDTPLMALTETICYAIQLVRCRKSFDGEFKRDDWRTMRLVLAAPETYWRNWSSNKSNWRIDLRPRIDAMREIVNRVSKILSYKICFEIHSLTCQDGLVGVESVGLN